MNFLVLFLDFSVLSSDLSLSYFLSTWLVFGGFQYLQFLHVINNFDHNLWNDWKLMLIIYALPLPKMFFLSHCWSLLNTQKLLLCLAVPQFSVLQVKFLSSSQ